MNKPELNSEWTCRFDNLLYKVVGFKTVSNGRHGVETVRFIKSRNEWATTPVCFSYLDLWNTEDQDDVEASKSSLFHAIFKQA